MNLSVQDLQNLMAMDRDAKSTRKPGEKSSFAAGRSLPGRNLHWYRWHLGLAVLRSGNQADNRDNGAGTRLVAGGQADDHELGSAARLDEATGSPREGVMPEHRTLASPPALLPYFL